jgi:hypothetical protein
MLAIINTRSMVHLLILTIIKRLVKRFSAFYTNGSSYNVRNSQTLTHMNQVYTSSTLFIVLRHTS